MIKSLNDADIDINTQLVHKTFNVSDESAAYYNIIIQDGINEEWDEVGEVNLDGTYKSSIFHSIYKIYYSVDYNMVSYNKLQFINMDINDSIVVCNIPQELFGLQIQPGTIDIVSGSVNVVDDENYNLVYNDVHIGNVFYETGHLVITNESYLNLFDNYTLSFESSEQLSEYSVICNVMEHEFNYPSNPTSFSGSAYMPSIISEELNPYITSLGLYNEFNELVAIAKFPKPVKKHHDIDISFLVKFDF